MRNGARQGFGQLFALCDRAEGGPYDRRVRRGSKAPNGNERGRRSKEEILDAAARVMALRGYAAATITAITAETGMPRSAIYHHFHSKGGLLAAVMERGARDYFGAMREAHAQPPEGGTHHERMAWFMDRTAEVFTAKPDFLRLHVRLVMSDEAADEEVLAMNRSVRAEGRAYMSEMVASAFADEGPEIARAVGEELSVFAIAAFDGSFVSAMAEAEYTVASQMDRLTDAMVALGEAAVARHKASAPAS